MKVTSGTWSQSQTFHLDSDPRFGKMTDLEGAEQVRLAQRSLDPHVRMAAFGEIQRILIEDVVMIPNYERGQMFIQDPRLRGVRRRAIGAEPDFTGAYLVPAGTDTGN